MVISYYNNFHESYGWTLAEIDQTNMEYLLDLLVVRDKVNHKDDEANFDDIF